jgi:aconitate hydratase
MEKKEFIRRIDINGDTFSIVDMGKLEQAGLAPVSTLPYSIRILVENLFRKLDDRTVLTEDFNNIAGWQPSYDAPVEIPFHPARVLMQDFTGVPAVVDLAAMRDAVAELGGDPAMVNPTVPVDLIADHSIQVDYFGTSSSLSKNVEKEYERNSERYTLLKWAQQSFTNFKVVPPNSGICHQVNLENLAQVVFTETVGGETVAYPDTLVGTDSHTTMINGIGVMGWGVGGIEAEAVMLGQPYYMAIPEVVGVKLTGKLNAGVTATDLVLSITHMLRQQNVVEKFVEFFGTGMKRLSLTDRATIANMAPEYGATMGFFPVDEKTVDYLNLTGRSRQARIVEAYTKENGLFYTGETDPDYTRLLAVDLSTIKPATAGPARPQDHILLEDVKTSFYELIGCDHERDVEIETISTFTDESGCQTEREDVCVPGKKKQVLLKLNDKPVTVADGSVVIAAITSCTNTSNPSVLVGAGLLAKKAVERGVTVPPHVKTSFAPGSRAVPAYLENSGLMPYLEALGFHVAGFGCTTCIGNSGPLRSEIEKAVVDNKLTVAAVLSGNRNFEARIHQRIKGNFLMSPILVVAFAIAGKIDVDVTKDPLTMDPNGDPVYLKDIWPSEEEIEKIVAAHVKTSLYNDAYRDIFEGDTFWKALPDIKRLLFEWDPASTYIKRPPYFEGLPTDPIPPEDMENGRALMVVGNSVTTDHISPAGAIPVDYPAGSYLISKRVEKDAFNSYGSRRGNHEVMMRGTFGNIRIKNMLVTPEEGSWTLKLPEREKQYVYDAAIAYGKESVPLVVLAGREYGTGSSRDWAAKGTRLLGVRVVLAESFERIHRSNLVGMGVLPLMFTGGESWENLGLDGTETYAISGIADMVPQKKLKVTASRATGETIEFGALARLDTVVEVDYFVNGGILPFVLRKMMRSAG